MRSVRVATPEEVCYYGRTLPLGLLAPIGGGAGLLDHALGTVASSNASPRTMTVSNSVSVGELVVAYAGTTANAVEVLSDSGGNTYTAVDSDATINGGIAMAASILTVGLTGATSTISSTGTAQLNGVGAASFFGLKANAATTAYAKQISAAGNTITTSASVNAGDLVVAVFQDSSVFTVTQPGSWALLNNNGNLVGAYLVPSSTGTVTYAPTITAGTSIMAIAAFPAAPAGGVQLQRQTTRVRHNVGRAPARGRF